MAYLGTIHAVISLRSGGMDIPLMKEASNKPESKWPRETVPGARVTRASLVTPHARRICHPGRRATGQPEPANRLPVTPWVAGFWIQPIDKS